MDKFTFKTADGVDVNLEKLSRAFPEVITERMGEDGKIKRVADFEKLKMLLGDSAAERPQEFYEFTWPGKNEAIFEAAKATTKTLRPCPEESKNWDTTQNLYIEGDNLEALKILQEAYLGKVKMIYIDPPYNTGKDFVYRDNFHKSAEEGKADETVRDEETDNNLFQNTESNGRFHSDWCSMIYPRLKLARDLLRDDGVIFISIDDNEVHNLRKICDEIFGESNFVANIIWEQGRKSIATQIAINHEYCLVYCKNKSKNIEYDKNNDNKNWKSKKKGLDLIYNEYEILKKKFNNDCEKISLELKKFYKSLPEDNPAKAHSHYQFVDQFLGIYHPDNISQGTGQGGRFEIIHPITQKPCKIPKGGWRFSQTKLPELLSEHKIVFGADESTVPCLKRYLKETEYEVYSSVFYKDGRGASKRLDTLFERKIFDYPKDEIVVKDFISLVTSYPNSNDIILDFFSGSATTAHACMQLNAEDGGNRKFIMVQLPEVCAPDSEAAKAGYKNICEIGKERIRRAGEKIKAEHATTAPNLDIGFRVLKIDESIMKDVFYSPNETSQDLLSTLESNIKEDRTDLDLLFACLVDWGVELSMPLKTESIDGVEIHTMSDGDTPALIACFAQNIPETVVRKIAARHPLRAVFRDSSFADSPSKINLTEIFKTYSPETEIKVL